MNVENSFKLTNNGLYFMITGAKPPAHLNGSLPGDSGFDPLGLGVDPERLKWCVVKVHAS